MYETRTATGVAGILGQCDEKQSQAELDRIADEILQANERLSRILNNAAMLVDRLWTQPDCSETATNAVGPGGAIGVLDDLLRKQRDLITGIEDRVTSLTRL